MYGEQKMRDDGTENSSQRYVVADDGRYALSVSNDGVYGSSCGDGALNITLLRSPVYTAHPIKERPIIPDDRFNPHIDQGERRYSFRIIAGKSDFVRRETPRVASILNDGFMPVSYYPPTSGKKSMTPISISGNVLMPVFKKAGDGNGFIVRLFNPSGMEQKYAIDSLLLEKRADGTLQPWEIQTYRLFDENIKVSAIDENEP